MTSIWNVYVTAVEGRRLAKRASNRIKELNERRLDSSISREKCVQCAWFLYTFLPVPFYFSIPPLLPFPRRNFPLPVSKNPSRKKKKRKKDSFSFRERRKFWSFFSLTTHRGKFLSISFFFILVLSFDTFENWLRLIFESIIPSGIWFVLLLEGREERREREEEKRGAHL